MKIKLLSLARIGMWAVLACISQCVFAQLELGYCPGKFLVDVAVDKDESHYLLGYYNVVQVFNKDKAFVRKFSVQDGQVYPVLKAIEVDAGKHLHIVDDANDVIQVYSAEGAFVKHVALEGGNYRDFAMDETGNYYMVEHSANVVQVFDKEGVKIREFGKDVFGSLYSIHVASNGNIFICDTGVYGSKAATVWVFDNEGNYVANVGVAGGGAYSTYQQPTAVQTDVDGYVYVYSSTKVIKYSPIFQFMQEYNVYNLEQGVHSAGYAVCLVHNKLFFADSHYHRVQVFDTALAYQYTLAGFSADEGKFDVPEGMAVDADNHIYVADTRNYRVQVFDDAGNFKIAFGGHGTGDDRFSYLSDVAVDSDAGIVYVLDHDGVKKFSKAGVFLGKFLTGIAYAGKLALDKAGLIYVNDPDKKEVKVFSGAGVLLRSIPVVGVPYSITIGPDDLIYVTGSVSFNNKSVQIFSLDGSLINNFDLPAENRGISSGIAVSEDFIFIADGQGVRKFHKDGTLVAPLESGKGDVPGGINMELPDYVLYRPSLALWKDQILVSDVLRVQSFPIKQVITFPEIAPKRFGEGPSTIVASASSGYPVTLTVSDPSIATIHDNNVVVLHKTGTVTLTATQSGTGFLEAAEPVSRDLTVLKGEQIIIFNPIGERILGDAPVVLEAASSAGLPVSFITDDPSIVRIEGTIMTMLTDGKATIKAVQEGNAFYEPAEVSQTVVVNLITGVEKDFKATDVYPNPTHDRINLLLFDEAVRESLFVVDNMGRSVPVAPGSITIDGGRLEVNLSDLASGIYYLHITTRRQGVRVHKVIKL